jgi:hypothetical protein
VVTRAARTVHCGGERLQRHRGGQPGPVALRTCGDRRAAVVAAARRRPRPSGGKRERED